MRTDLIATKTTAVAATLSAIETSAMAVVEGFRLKRRSASRRSLTVVIYSLVPQRDHGIDLGRAARGTVASSTRHANHHNGNSGHRKRVRRSYTIQKTRHEPGERKRR